MWLSILGLEKGKNAKEKKKTNSRTKNKDYRSQMVIPYVEGVSERVHRVKKCGVATAMCPHTTLRHLLVHPQDKVESAEQGGLVYQITSKKVLWCRVYWRDRETTENTTGRTQEGSRQHEQ